MQCRIHELTQVLCLPLSDVTAHLNNISPVIDPPSPKKARSDGKQQKYPLISNLGFTADDLAGHGGVNRKTAQSYILRKEAPYAVGKLTELYMRGRVLREKWNHCFINSSGKLELYGIGEVSETDIENIQWVRQFHASQIRTLEFKLAKAERCIEQLEEHLNAARAAHGDAAAANDPLFIPTQRR